MATGGWTSVRARGDNQGSTQRPNACHRGRLIRPISPGTQASEQPLTEPGWGKANKPRDVCVLLCSLTPRVGGCDRALFMAPDTRPCEYQRESRGSLARRVFPSGKASFLNSSARENATEPSRTLSLSCRGPAHPAVSALATLSMGKNACFTKALHSPSMGPTLRSQRRPIDHK